MADFQRPAKVEYSTVPEVYGTERKWKVNSIRKAPHGPFLLTERFITMRKSINITCELYFHSPPQGFTACKSTSWELLVINWNVPVV